MIEITYQHHGNRPSQTDTIREDANTASTLPSSFEVVGLRYDDPEFVLLADQYERFGHRDYCEEQTQLSKFGKSGV